MKSLFFLSGLLLIKIVCFAQFANYSNTKIMTLDGSWTSFGSIQTDGKPMILVFWNTDTRACCEQVRSLMDARDAVLSEYKVKLVSIFVETGNRASLLPMVSGRNWEMEIFIDVNSCLKHALAIPGLPFTQLYDPNMKLICSYLGYCSGTEDLLCKKLKECLADTMVKDISKY